jgi:hypothetical protein
MYYIFETQKIPSTSYKTYTMDTVQYINNINYINRHIFSLADCMKPWMYDFRIILYKNNKNIMMSEKYNFLNLDVIKKFKVRITPDYIYTLCVNRRIKELNYLKNTSEFMDIVEKLRSKDLNGYAFDMLYNISNVLSANGYVDILELLFNSKLLFGYDNNAIDNASANGHIHVLEWWKNSSLQLKYSSNAMTYASAHGHVHVLDWWINSGLSLKYDEYNLLESASMYGHVKVLDWLINCKLNKYDKYPIYLVLCSASRYGQVKVLEWCLNNKSKLLFEYDNKPLEYASANGHIHVLNWWLTSKLQLKYDEKALERASLDGRINVLEWWKDSGLLLKYNKTSLDSILDRSSKNVLRWWKKSGINVNYWFKLKLMLYA